MNFTITRQNLHAGLAAVSASIPSKTTLPVLSNILFEARDDSVWMNGTDLDVAVRIKVPADVKEAGSLTAPGKKLQEITRELPDAPVEVATRGDQIELSCGRSRFKLNGLPADEFPTLPSISFDDAWTVKGKDLHSLIHHTSFAVSTEESRPILNGVLWELRDGAMRMVATNGHRLARMSIPAQSSDVPSADFIVPPAALQQVQRLFKDDDTLEVSRDGNHLGFRSGSAEIFTRLIEGTYPNYEQVIPKDNDKKAIVSKKLLESAVRRMAVVASDQTHRIRLTFEDGRVHLSVLTPDLGEGHDELELDYAGEALEIGFNANYLLEVLKYMPTEEVCIAFKAPERAATIEPVASGGDAMDLLCLVMPLRLLD
ncbi:MAG: DNA polymerase III subunit beta [Gemmatimonadota bacterium]|nr:DNA polymerase III subunit beta [Gemmatimonadota bacterium]MDH5760718.1 DNA polymerase III subunit beta [Gemmatimonadota bacterium]